MRASASEIVSIIWCKFQPANIVDNKIRASSHFCSSSPPLVMNIGYRTRIEFDIRYIPMNEVLIDTISICCNIEAFLQCLHEKYGVARGWRAKHVRYDFDISKVRYLYRYIEISIHWKFDISIYLYIISIYDTSKYIESSVFQNIETVDTISNANLDPAAPIA